MAREWFATQSASRKSDSLEHVLAANQEPPDNFERESTTRRPKRRANDEDAWRQAERRRVERQPRRDQHSPKSQPEEEQPGNNQ